MAPLDWDIVSQLNNNRRAQEHASPQTILLKNVLYFNGTQMTGPSNIFISDGMILEPSRAVDGTEVLDCSGKFLIPGLIDAHTHPIGLQDLQDLTKYGVTTTMSMAGFDAGHMASLKEHSGLVDVLVAGLPAAGPDNKHTKHMPGWPKDEILTSATQADDFVKRQIGKGADYIKILADVPGLDQDTVSACVAAAKNQSKISVCHAAELEPARQALRANADQLHHSPMNGLLTDEDVELYRQAGSVVCPTLSMMEAVANNFKNPNMTLENASRNVEILKLAGVTILCGTDANQSPGSPAKVPFGSSIHHELELLVGSGLSPAEALLSATLAPAKQFHLNDRGIITPSYRADLILLRRNPVEDIAATTTIERVWVKGIVASI